MRFPQIAKIACLLCAAALPVAAQAQFTFTTNADNTITITGYNGPGGDVTIPDTTNGLPVTGIGDKVFYNCTSLTNITIPNGVTSIGYSVFYNCTSLTSVTIPNSVTNIGNAAFNNCTRLNSVTILNSVTSIGVSAFYHCISLTNITIPHGVTSIGNSAFMYCFNLTNITLGDTITNIGVDAFFECTSLTSLTFPSSVISIGYRLFPGCFKLKEITVDSNNPAFSSGNGILFDKNQTALLCYPAAKLGTSYTIPCSVACIGYLAYDNCTGLNSITIPYSVTTLEDYAFHDCYNLTNIYFQGNAPSLGLDSFFMINNGIVYYLPGTTDWSSTLGGLPTAQWLLPNPTILNFEPNFGVQTNGFSFTISWATNVSIVVEGCTNLGGTWALLQTVSLTNGSFYFSDPQWTNYPGRFYRLRSP